MKHFKHFKNDFSWILKKTEKKFHKPEAIRRAKRFYHKNLRRFLKKELQKELLEYY